MAAEKMKYSNFNQDGTVATNVSNINIEKIKLPSHSSAVSSIKQIIKYLVSTIRTFPLRRIFSVMQLTVKNIARRLKSFSKRRTEVSSDAQMPKKQNPSFKNILKKLIIPAVLLFVFLILLTIFDWSPKKKGNGDSRVEVEEAKAEMDINRDFEFPLRNNKGKEISQFKYTIEKVEVRDQFIHQGKRATAIKGRTFVILNLKITNQYQDSINVPTRNYVRLTANNNPDEKLAPTMYNDPVEVQAISTKYTRIGFPIYDTDKDLMLLVGEITGDKVEVPLDQLL